MSLHFIKLRKYWYIISLVIILPGLISLAVQGLNKGIDFTGGNIIEISYDKPVAVETIRNTISSLKIKGSHAVQKIGETGYLIRTPHLTQDQNDDLLGALGSEEHKTLRSIGGQKYVPALYQTEKNLVHHIFSNHPAGFDLSCSPGFEQGH